MTRYYYSLVLKGKKNLINLAQRILDEKEKNDSYIDKDDDSDALLDYYDYRKMYQYAINKKLRIPILKLIRNNFQLNSYKLQFNNFHPYEWMVYGNWYFDSNANSVLLKNSEKTVFSSYFEFLLSKMDNVKTNEHTKRLYSTIESFFKQVPKGIVVFSNKENLSYTDLEQII
jgi:hypothetical protein